MAAQQEPTQPHTGDEDVAPVVAVGRTMLGILLVVVGLVAGVAGALWYFVVPWFGWARTDIWYDLAEWADLGGAALGIGGVILLIIGGALIQRARKKRLEIFMDASAFTPSEMDAAAFPPSGEDRRTPPPAAPAPPIV